MTLERKRIYISISLSIDLPTYLSVCLFICGEGAYFKELADYGGLESPKSDGVSWQIGDSWKCCSSSPKSVHRQNSFLLGVGQSLVYEGLQLIG